MGMGFLVCFATTVLGTFFLNRGRSLFRFAVLPQLPTVKSRLFLVALKLVIRPLSGLRLPLLVLLVRIRRSLVVEVQQVLRRQARGAKAQGRDRVEGSPRGGIACSVRVGGGPEVERRAVTAAASGARRRQKARAGAAQRAHAKATAKRRAGDMQRC